ncbi:hypothetical protein [Bacillus rhizoplanae]|uniref:hypothetical protein n=1 Tax=Bacillus rhizoplanae TaxID=2880966 RepID=UPI003D222351
MDGSNSRTARYSEELHEVEPYNLEWITSTLGIYEINSPEMKAAYFYAYRNLYKTKFENKKTNILTKIIKNHIFCVPYMFLASLVDCLSA